MIFSETYSKIAPALTKAWGELENPKHNSTVKVRTQNGGEYSFDYTDLGGIFDEAKRVFKEHGLSVLQNASTKEINGKLMISVETMILHSSGEWVRSEPLQMPANTKIQDMGGQITYMKRYSLSALLGIATEKDDDGNGASGNPYQMTKKNKTTEISKASDKQLNLITKLLKDKANDRFNENQLYDLLKQRLKINAEMENWTTQDAKRAIDFLTKAGA